MSILTSIFNALENVGRARTLAHLETLSDRTLDDLGFSRALMSQGVSAWPWKSEATINRVEPQSGREEIRAAIKELNSYNDRDLADLGLSRGDIKDAVINGRTGGDNNVAA